MQWALDWMLVGRSVGLTLYLYQCICVCVCSCISSLKYRFPYRLLDPKCVWGCKRHIQKHTHTFTCCLHAHYPNKKIRNANKSAVKKKLLSKHFHPVFIVLKLYFFCLFALLLTSMCLYLNVIFFSYSIKTYAMEKKESENELKRKKVFFMAVFMMETT